MGKEDTIDIKTITEDIARALICSCIVDDTYNAYHTKGKIFLSVGELDIREVENKPGRLDISGNWPKNKHGEWQYPSERERDEAGYKHITVDGSKDADKIAADIKKRFLPVYTALYEKMLKQGEASDKYYDNKQDTIALIEAEFCPELLKYPSKQDKANKDSRKQFSFWMDGIGGYGGVDVSSATSVDIDLRGLNADVAIRILKVIKEAVNDKVKV